MPNRYNQYIMTKKPNAATILDCRISAAQREQPATIDDAFAQAVGKQLESRGIARVPGLPNDDEPMARYDVAIELDRRHPEFEARREAQRQADEDATGASKTAADHIRQTITDRISRRDTPLNGPGILAAAGGNPYESNSFAGDSVAALIRQGLTRMEPPTAGTIVR